MKLTLKWHRHPKYRDHIIGINDKLPDSMCAFTISRLTDGCFWTMLPGLGTANFDTRFIFRDPDIARDFCEDFLNYNLRAILKNQIYEMKRRSLKTEKPPAYYENLINELDKVMDSHKTPPRGNAL